MSQKHTFSLSKSRKDNIIIDKTYGTLSSITIDWSGGAATTEVALYGSDEPYESSDAVYDDASCGTQVAVLQKGSSSKDISSTMTVPTERKYKYYALRLVSAAAIVNAMHFEYEASAVQACGAITVAQADGTLLTANSVVVPGPMDLTVSCATEGSVLTYEFNGESGTVSGNPGVVSVARGGTLVLTASKEGFEPNVRTIDITMPVKPIELVAGGEAMLTDVLRAYGKTSVVLSTPTPGAIISWTYGEVSGTGTELEVEADGVLTVRAEKDGFESATRTLEVRSLEPLDCIQNVWNAYPLLPSPTDAQPMKVLFESTVVYAANVLYDGQVSGQVFITDGTNFARIYFEGREVDFAPGDVIAAGWTSKLCRNGGWKDFTPQSELTVVSHDGVVPEPIVVADADALTPLDPGTPVVVRRATLDKDTSADVYIGDNHGFQINPKDANGQEILPMVNAFGLPSQPAGTYDIYGVVDFLGYRRTNVPTVRPTDGDYTHYRWRVAPTRYEQWLPTTPRPRFGHSYGAMLAAGTPIEISCQDAEATIMYSLDGGDYAEYSAESKPVMPEHDVTVTAYARKEGQHDSEARSISLRVDPNSGLTQIEADGATAADVRYYDLSGRACAQPLSAGVYIRLSGDRAEKVLVK
ncbi:MAG: hypothetical protein K2L74_06880 [Muribaculaceae bacterium]|nr:hypothetical protein [Muribaculaceae bacterium]